MHSAASEPAAESLEDSHKPAWHPPTRREIGALLSVGLLVLFCRLPRLLLHGRILAEEGTTYLRYAWDATPLRAMLAPHQGYYSLLDNLCALIAARLLPLSAAALFFTWTAVAVHLLLLFLAIECEVFRTPLERWCALFALLLVTPNFEVWLNLENCQSVLAVAAAIILISSARRLFAMRTATLVLAALTGVTTLPLVPLFWLRVWRERSRRAVVFAGCVTLPALLQSAVLLYSIRAGNRSVSSHHLRTLVAYISSRVIVLPLTTGRGAQYYGKFVFQHPGIGSTLALYLISCAPLVLGFLLFRRTSRAALLLYFGALLSSAFDWYGCLACTFNRLPFSSGGEGRYFFAANSMLLLALLLAATRATPRCVSTAAAVMFAWILCTGSFHYFRMRPYLNDYPAWQPQVRRWQQDERQPIIVGPAHWPANPLHLTHQYPNRTDLPANAYDSLAARTLDD
jgi:hypothetical protein